MLYVRTIPFLSSPGPFSLLPIAPALFSVNWELAEASRCILLLAKLGVSRGIGSRAKLVAFQPRNPRVA